MTEIKKCCFSGGSNRFRSFNFSPGCYIETNNKLSMTLIIDETGGQNGSQNNSEDRRGTL